MSELVIADMDDFVAVADAMRATGVVSGELSFPNDFVDAVSYIAGSGKSTPRNLLDNSYFVNPINQRGQTSYNAGGYFFDRWRTWTADDKGSISYDAESKCLVITTPSTGDMAVYQRLTKGVLNPNKQYTFAYCLDDGTILLGARIDYSPVDYDSVEFYIDAGTTSRIKWVALYEGEYTADSLPEYQYKGYAVELAECMRYFIAYNFAEVLLNARVFASNPKYADITLPTSGILRTNPTVINNLQYCAILVSNTGWEGKITSASASGNMVNLVFETNDGTNMTASALGNCRMIGNLMLSADL